ncbi:MAG: type IV pilus modification protein PilV [Oleiphilaceae bacterium]|nr:type IV pilus modification protein PilV [Oleiphilaceae bacterium]
MKCLNNRARRGVAPRLRSPRHDNSGFSLMEVMIALVILTIGLLGVAGVQLLSLQQTGNAQLRSQATMLAEDLASRVRINNDNPPSSTELDRIRRNMRLTMGQNADLSVTTSSNDMVIVVTWEERDPFAEGGTSTESFTLRARSQR